MEGEDEQKNGPDSCLSTCYVLTDYITRTVRIIYVAGLLLLYFHKVPF